MKVPYPDDERLNFGYFQYDGIPDYETNVGTFPASDMDSVPVYHVLTTSANFNLAVAYNRADQIDKNNFDARSEYNWNCIFGYKQKHVWHFLTKARGISFSRDGLRVGRGGVA